MIVGIDHVIVAVEELTQAANVYRRMGFQVLPGGDHPRFGTHNALVPLADGAYFELIAIKRSDLAAQFPFGQQVQEALSRVNRFVGFALESDALSQDVEAIRDRGLAVQKAPPGGRVRPDGQQVDWKTAHPEDGRLPFLIQDVTARSLRIPGPTEGIGCSAGISALELGTGDLQPVMTLWSQLLGERPDERRFAMKRGTVGLSQSFSGDEVQMITLTVDDVGRVAREWEARQVPFYDEGIRGMGRVLVPRETGGAKISFRQAS